MFRSKIFHSDCTGDITYLLMQPKYVHVYKNSYMYCMENAKVNENEVLVILGCIIIGM